MHKLTWLPKKLKLLYADEFYVVRKEYKDRYLRSLLKLAKEYLFRKYDNLKIYSQ